MRAVYSSTCDPKYSFFIPITSWCWHKLGVRSLIFVPTFRNSATDFALKTASDWITFLPFSAPEHKEATYAQCSRLYAACLDLPEDEVLVTSDVDMCLFKVPEYISGFTITGTDLVPPKQYPICYIAAKVKDWRNAFDLHGKTYHEKLDELLGHIEAEHFRGNYWGKDQETAYNTIWLTQEINTIRRSNGQNQFATKRYDRDDAYILDRLNPDTTDFHMNRPGYEEKNFDIIVNVLQYHFPYEDFKWLIDYKDAYLKLL